MNIQTSPIMPSSKVRAVSSSSCTAQSTATMSTSSDYFSYSQYRRAESPATTTTNGSDVGDSIRRVSPLPRTSLQQQQDAFDMMDWEHDMDIDTLAAMLRQEVGYMCQGSRHGMNSNDAPPPNVQLSILYPEWRTKITDWCYRVVDHFQYEREVVGIMMNLFDRYCAIVKAREDGEGNNKLLSPSSMGGQDIAADPMSSPRDVTTLHESPSPSTCAEEEESRRYQLGAMAALFLVIKLNGETVPAAERQHNGDDASYFSRLNRRHKRRLRLMEFVELSRGQFDPADIADMERVMLSTLKWKVNPPTPTIFVGHFLKLLPTTNMVQRDLIMHVLQELSRYLTELSVCLADVTTIYRPSWIAYASLLISLDAIHLDALPLENRVAFHSAVAHLTTDRARCEHDQQQSALSPDCKAVQFLVQRIRTSFLPEMLLDAGGVASAASSSYCTSSVASSTSNGSLDSTTAFQGHPIAIARNAGLLNPAIFQLTDDVGGMTLTPSPSDEDFSKSSSATGNDGPRRSSCHRREQSASSVMDNVSNWQQQLLQHEQQQATMW